MTPLEFIREKFGDRTLLDIRQMTEVINHFRVLRGHKPVQEQTVWRITSKQEYYANQGLPFIPGYKINPEVLTSPWVCDVNAFLVALPGILERAEKRGPRKKKDRPPRQSGGVRPRGQAWQMQIERIHKKAQQMAAPPEDVKATVQATVNHQAGYRPCGFCNGLGETDGRVCEYCNNGWRVANPPCYRNGYIVRDGDIVQMPFIPELNSIAFGRVLSFRADGTLHVQCIDHEQRVTHHTWDGDVSDVRFLHRREQRLY